MSDDFNPAASPYPRTIDEPSESNSPYAGRKIRFGEHLAISGFWFATNFHWGAFLILLLPNQVRTMVPQHSAAVLGLLTGFAAFVALIVPLLVGALSDRCFSRLGRRRPYMLWGVVINVVGLLLMAVAYYGTKPVPIGESSGVWDAIAKSPGLVLYFFAYLVVQFGNNVATSAYSGFIPDLVDPNQRGTASGFMALMSQVGTLAGAIACGMLLGSASEGVKYAVIAVVMVTIMGATLLFVKERPLETRPPKIEWGPYIKSLWISPRKFPDFAWVWITRALVMLGFYAIQPFINYYLVDVIGISPKEVDSKAPILLAVILISASISGVLGGIISDRIGRKKVVYYANAMIAVMTIAFIFCGTFNQVLLAGFFFGLGFGAYTSVDWALGTEVLPSKDANAAKEMAVWHIAMTLPQSIGAPLAGYALSKFGERVEVVPGVADPVLHYQPGGYAMIFIFCAISFGLGAFLLRNVRGVR